MYRKITFDELQKLRDELGNCIGVDSCLIVGGKTYYTDIGYAFEGIDMFLDVLKNRLDTEVGFVEFPHFEFFKD